MFEYKIKNKSKISRARIGVFSTPHGDIETPVFMSVGTVGAVKTMTPKDLDDLDAQIILANTYHLYLRPGEEIIKKAGGLHGYTRREKPFLTDSGGFQVFSLGESRVNKNSFAAVKPAKISEKGVKFYSHLDGSEHFISPEKSIKIQEDLGADIIMAFDECPPADITKNALKESVERTHRWLCRCVKAKTRKDQALFPICQGGTDLKLRRYSAEYIQRFDLPGNTIGGVSVGEPKEKIYEIADFCASLLDENKPRYLMGIGYPEDIVEIVRHGIDMFDCVLPSRLARHGVVWVKAPKKQGIKLNGLGYNYEQVNLSNSEHKNDFGPIDKKCSCYTCKSGFSRSYIKHLISEQEPLGIHLTTIHNLAFTFDLVSDIKAKIKQDKF